MRRPLLAVAVAALAFCGGARAAAPNAAARAFYVVNASNGDVLAARHADDRVPIASITKLMTVLVALHAGALIQSANNAADALASAAANGSVPTFVRWMNERARELGLRDTHFVRPDGLDAPGHYSSARDVAVLARVAMHRKLVRDLVRLRSDTIEGGAFVVHTWNDLL